MPDISGAGSNEVSHEQKALHRTLYERLALIRCCEEQLNDAFAQNLFPGYIHSYLGQEACAVGVCSVLRKDDTIVSTHRGRGHYLAKGMPLKPMMAEMFGKATGIGGGRGGEMHAADPEHGILGGNGIVGGGIPYAAGAAYAAVLDGADRVSVAFFGEGASNEGSFHETLNVAAAWKLPLIMVCENNLYAEMTPFRETVGEADVAKRAEGYGVPGEIVDGNNVLAVLDAARRAVAHARSGAGPTLLELKTYRWGGHFQGDPRKYRSREEEALWQERCPLRRFRELAHETGTLSADEADAIDAEAAEAIAAAIRYALESADPKPSDALLNVYAS
ncbi:thiamine pyrophosphate-dependent dehydrogenase E1 component subunit alpha [Bosea sp. (in: a-proteobacteria)]|uniref:thiamine pyrophosphate-dependent dehydrogenase E1 component subunit alpha n=1 Tax=Bosea sp. (in: a-proteobacteria) TaxID=1871050 RepID=UPI003B3B9EB3